MSKSSVTSFSIDIYADGPTEDEIAMLDKTIVSGYTFNPTLFKKLKVSDYLGHCRKVLQACGDVPVSLEAFADDIAGMVRQARILDELGPNVFVKIPITFTSGESTLPVIETLVKDGLKLNITAVFTKKQVDSILPALKNAHAIISVFAGRLFDVGIDAVEATGEIAKLVRGNSNCKTLWASPRMVYDVKNACAAGCDIITMAPDLIKKTALFNKSPEEHSLATVRMFYQDAKTSGYEL